MKETRKFFNFCLINQWHLKLMSKDICQNKFNQKQKIIIIGQA